MSDTVHIIWIHVKIPQSDSRVAWHVTWETRPHFEVLAAVLALLKPIQICCWFQSDSDFFPGPHCPEQQGLETWAGEVAGVLPCISYHSSVASRANIPGRCEGESYVVHGRRIHWTGSPGLGFPHDTGWGVTSLLCNPVKGKEEKSMWIHSHVWF